MIYHINCSHTVCIQCIIKHIISIMKVLQHLKLPVYHMHTIYYITYYVYNISYIITYLSWWRCCSTWSFHASNQSYRLCQQAPVHTWVTRKKKLKCKELYKNIAKMANSAPSHSILLGGSDYQSLLVSFIRIVNNRPQSGYGHGHVLSCSGFHLPQK